MSQQNNQRPTTQQPAAAPAAKPKVQTVIAVHSLKYKGKLHAPDAELELDEVLATALLAKGAVKTKTVTVKAKDAPETPAA